MSELPDPLLFSTRALTARGALVEVREGDAVALLPPALGRALHAPEELTLATHPGEGSAAVACGIGSPLLERLSADARRAAPWAVVAPELDAPKVTQATTLAARLVVRNGLLDVLDAAAVTALYARVTLAWAVEADDRYEGLFAVELGPARGEPVGLRSLLDVTSRDDELPRGRADAAEVTALLDPLPGRAARALAEAAREALASVERRHERDHERMTEYYRGMLAEVGGGRRKVDPATLASRSAAVVADRDARLRDLAVRYTPKVTMAPAALLVASVPVVRVRVRLRRRKLDRELRLTLPATATALDLLPCDGCDDVTARPALCDDRLHALCERCAPQAQGRLTCPACARSKR